MWLHIIGPVMPPAKHGSLFVFRAGIAIRELSVEEQAALPRAGRPARLFVSQDEIYVINANRF